MNTSPKKIKKAGVGVLILSLCTSPLAYSAPDVSVSRAEYDNTVRSAREGQATGAAEKFKAWHQADPGNKKILHDLVVVLGWASDFSGAMVYFAQLANDQTPPYVLKSLGYSALALERWGDAENAYRLALKATPNDTEAHAGVVKALFGQNRADDALLYVQALLPKFSSAYKPSDAANVMLLGSVHTRRAEPLLASNAYQSAVRLDPQSREAFRSYVFSLSGAGMPHLAARTADRHLEFFNADEKRLIAHAGAGQTVNFGQAQLGVDYKGKRFATTDQSLNENARVTARFSEKPITEFDRLVALRDRQQMNDVVVLYESLVQSGVTIPPYAKSAAADAYLYLEQPEKSRDLYLAALEEARAADAANVDAWKIGLAYAYSEAEQHNAAQAVADDLFPNTPAYANNGLQGVQSPNGDYSTVALLPALLRMYAERLNEAETRIAALRTAAPFNMQIRQGWADLQMSRAHPRAALEEYELMQVDEPKAVAPQIGRGNALVALNQYTEAKETLPALQADYPENKGVQNLARQVDIYGRPYLQITTTLGNGGGRAGAESVVDARLYSAPLTNSLGDAYRVFSRITRASGSVDSGTPDEADVARTRVGVGIDYRVRDLTASAEVNQAFRRAERMGIALSLTKDLSDAWQVRLGADSNVNDLSARAYNADISAKRVTAGIRWLDNESRNIDAEVSNTRFSDDNRRDTASIAWTERLISGPVFKLDTIVGLATSRNSSPNAVYFNPASDKEATLTLIGDWRTWRRYKRYMSQQLQVFGGRYWQEGFDSGPTSGIQYGHAWSLDDAFFLSYGVGTSKHPYDGVRERRNYGYMNLNWAIK